MSWRPRGAKPWQRYTIGRAIDGSGIMVEAPKRGLTPAAYGRECERAAFKTLQRDGWYATWSHLSRGAADITATRNTLNGEAITRLIQVKATLNFYPAFLNAGLREILTAPRVHSREVFGYVHGQGLAVQIAVGQDGIPHVTGKEPYRGDVAAALTRMRSLPNDRRSNQATNTPG